jgi:1-phosphatidylinositol phosphodiesterase
LQILALGTGDVQGMNQRLLPWLTERKGQRFGIISAFLLGLVNLLSLSLNIFVYIYIYLTVFDFYDAVPGLVAAAIGL